MLPLNGRSSAAIHYFRLRSQVACARSLNHIPIFFFLSSWGGDAPCRKSHKVYPPAPETFSALNHTPLDKVKVVIVGQDPYHGPNQAHGLCFSVRRGIKTPPSLHNMYKELIQDADIQNFKDYPSHGNLERWAQQGVLMINTVMTVRQGEPNSHQNKGWEAVTDEIIRAVDRRAKQNSTQGNQPAGVVFLLWGKPATAKCETALGVSNLSSSTPTHRHIICTSHPSPLGATKTKSPFMGSKCFSRANDALKKFGYDQLIDWRVDGALP